MFARRPAPVQVSWLGYFATTGLSEMDYFLGDPYVAPLDESDQFTEKIWQLPETYLCFTPPNFDLKVGELPALYSNYVTFGCLNNLTKVNIDVLTLWARVLNAIPQSRILFKTKELSSANCSTMVLQEFFSRGISGDRIILEGLSPRYEHMAAYNRVDIALDPFPFPGGTTSVEGLWMGVPFITRRGNSFLSHIGESIACNAGLSDWIAQDDDDYIAKAIEKSKDINGLSALRSHLRQQVMESPLFDASRFARHFEEALWGMWNKWVKSQSSADAK